MFLLDLSILDKIKKGFSFVGVERGVSSPTASRQLPTSHQKSEKPSVVGPGNMVGLWLDWVMVHEQVHGAVIP